jgi:hypothetical protein
VPTQLAHREPPTAVSLSLRCDAAGRVLHTGDDDHRGLRFAQQLRSGAELLGCVHPAFLPSARAQLRDGGTCQLLMSGSDGGSYVATMCTVIAERGEREISFEIGELVIDAAKLSPATLLPLSDAAMLPEGTRVRVVTLFSANTDRMVLQYSPGRIVKALSNALEDAQEAAGPGATVTTGGFGSIVFTGRFDDSRLASRIRDAISARRPGEPHVEFYMGEATGRWPGVWCGVRRAHAGTPSNGRTGTGSRRPTRTTGSSGNITCVTSCAT